MSKNKVGRPTIYTPELLKKSQGYVDIYESLGDVIPSIEGLSIYLDIARSTLYKWETEKPEFSDILRKINVVQKNVLLNQGLSGNFNANICKLVLGKHGYSEKNQTEISGPDGQAIEQRWSVEFIESKDKK